jgi:uncharacterized membrane protein YfcA
VAGFVSGLFGVGGGIIVVPGLVILFSFDQYAASGTSSATIVASAAAALLIFGSDGSVDIPAAVVLATAAAAGAWAGARYVHRIPERTLTLIFVGVLLLAALRLGLA